MRILYYSPHPQLQLRSNTGYGTHMREMIAAFRSMGHDVSPYIVADVNGENEEEFVQQNIPNNAKIQNGSFLKTLIKTVTPNFAWSSIKDLRLLNFDRKIKNDLKDAIVEWKPDVIYERCNYLQTSGVEVANQMGIPHILEVNSPYVEEHAFLEKGYNLLYQKAKAAEQEQAMRTTMLVVVSTALKNYYMDVLGIDSNKIVVIPNAIKSNFCSENYDFETRRKLDLENKKVFGFVGSFFRWHGIDLLIKAFNEIEDPDTRLLIVGSGEIENELKLLANKQSRAADIIFTGEVRHVEIYDYIQAMDICVLARSHWYGSPVKLFEYGAMGKPIIAPDNIPVNDIMSHGEDALLVKPTVRSLTDAMQELLDNPQLATKIAENFKKKVNSEYIWIKHAGKILEAFGSLSSREMFVKIS